MNASPGGRFRWWATLLVMLSITAIDFLIGTTLADEVPQTGLLDKGSPLNNFIDFGSDVLLLVLAVVFWLRGRYRALLITIVLFAAEVTFGVVFNLVGLIYSIRSQNDAISLLIDASLLWTNNILVFSIWYWLIDSGGPDRRPQARKHDLLFPQQASDIPGWEHWQPSVGSYLFLAFSHSTAFSPTDTLLLSWKIKLLVVGQALISLIILAMLAARAINIISDVTPFAG